MSELPEPTFDPEAADVWIAQALRRSSLDRAKLSKDQRAAEARAREIIPHHDDIIAIAVYVQSMKLRWPSTMRYEAEGWTKFRIALFQSFVLSMLAGDGVMLEADQSSAGSIFNHLSELTGFGDSLESVGEDEGGQ